MLDVVASLPLLANGDFPAARDELAAAVAAAARAAPEGRHIVVRAVIETCYLQPAAWRLAARLAHAAGCDGVVCATGLGPEGATPAAIEALRAELRRGGVVKAQGGIRALADAQRALGAGADLLGVADPASLLAELAEPSPPAAAGRRPDRLRAVDDLPSWAAWLLVALVLFGAEALTLQFVLVYFGLGALVATAASPFVGTAGQGLVFAGQLGAADGADAAAADRLVGPPARSRDERRDGHRALGGRDDRRRQPRQHGAGARRLRSTGRRARPATTIRRSRRRRRAHRVGGRRHGAGRAARGRPESLAIPREYQ